MTSIMSKLKIWQARIRELLLNMNHTVRCGKYATLILPVEQYKNNDNFIRSSGSINNNYE
jgi:hypothetical protein